MATTATSWCTVQSNRRVSAFKLNRKAVEGVDADGTMPLRRNSG
jgi:hypothetical protein